MPQHVSQARRLAGMALARVIGNNAAARTIGVEPKTVASWLEADPDSDHDEQAWRAAQALAQERMLTGLAKGDPRGLAAWATAAGIASRNVRYSQLIARREQRREAEKPAEPEPEAEWLTALDALDEVRTDLYAAKLRVELAKVRAGEPGDPESWQDDAAMLAHIQRLQALSDNEVREQLLALEPQWATHYNWPPPRIIVATILDQHEEALKPPEPVAAAPEPPRPAPTPPSPAWALPAPSGTINAGLHVVRDDEEDPDEHLWRPIE